MDFVSATLEFLAMPDQVHNSERDFCYFVLADYFCVASYQQIATSKVKERTKEMTRATIQKSLCYFTKNFNFSPLGLSFLRAKVQETVDVYFSQSLHSSFDDKSVLIKLYNDMPSINQLISSPTANIPEHRYMKCSPVLRLLSRFGRNVLTLFKLLLLEKKVVIYGVPAGETSDIIVALTSLIPLFAEKHSQIGFLAEGSAAPVPSTSSGSSTSPILATQQVTYSAAESEYANLKLPLPIARYTYVSGGVVLNQADWLCGLPSYFVGTCNALFAQHRQVLSYDACFDANLAHMTIPSPALSNAAAKLTPEDIIFIDHVLSKVQAEVQDDPFAEFLVVDDLEPDAAAATHSHSSSDKFGGFSADQKSTLGGGGVTHTPGTASAWYSKETWVRTMFGAYVKALCAGTCLQNNGTHTNARVDAYGGHFLLDWAQTNNFKAWRAQIDIREVHADPSFNTLAHPAFALPQAPKTLVGKSFQTVKGSISSVSSATTSLVSALGSAWNHRSQQNQAIHDGWGLDGIEQKDNLQKSPSPAPSPSISAPPQTHSHQHQPQSQNNDTYVSPSIQTEYKPAVSGNVENQVAAAANTSASPNRGFSGFFESVKQKIASPFGRTERADRAAAQFESISTGVPTVVQPAQLSNTVPQHSFQDQQQQQPLEHQKQPLGDDEDLLGF